MISVEEALDHCLALAAPLEAEAVPLTEAAGRWMCAPALAQRDQPPFRRLGHGWLCGAGRPKPR